MKQFFCYLTVLVIFLFLPSWARAQSNKKFETNFTTVYYDQDKDLDDFIWKLGGQRLESLNDTSLASNRIDRIIRRVESILDIWPKNFKIDVYLHRNTLKANKVAYYESGTNSIQVSIDYASDGVFAHEIAHAVIYRAFPSLPSSRTQEILCQYVDQHLWSDY